MTARPRALALLLALLCAACATSVSDERLDAKLREAGASVHGLGTKSSTFPIQADSRVAAWTLAAEAKQKGPLPLARQLARRMELATKQHIALIVGGPYSDLSRTVVLDAFELSQGEDLRGLVFVYVGSADSARDLRAAAARAGVRFVQRELP